MTPDEIAGDQPLRDQVDLDSMDFLNFLIGLHGKLGIDIPEADYAKLTTLDDLVSYLNMALERRATRIRGQNAVEWAARYGGRYADALGIDLDSGSSGEIFKWSG